MRIWPVHAPRTFYGDTFDREPTCNRPWNLLWDTFDREPTGNQHVIAHGTAHQFGNAVECDIAVQPDELAGVLLEPTGRVSVQPGICLSPWQGCP